MEPIPILQTNACYLPGKEITDYFDEIEQLPEEVASVTAWPKTYYLIVSN
jgi:hypothetical protein